MLSENDAALGREAVDALLDKVDAYLQLHQDQVESTVSYINACKVAGITARLFSEKKAGESFLFSLARGFGARISYKAVSDTNIAAIVQASYEAVPLDMIERAFYARSALDSVELRSLLDFPVQLARFSTGNAFQYSDAFNTLLRRIKSADSINVFEAGLRATSGSCESDTVRVPGGRKKWTTPPKIRLNLTPRIGLADAADAKEVAVVVDLISGIEANDKLLLPTCEYGFFQRNRLDTSAINIQFSDLIETDALMLAYHCQGFMNAALIAIRPTCPRSIAREALTAALNGIARADFNGNEVSFDRNEAMESILLADEIIDTRQISGDAKAWLLFQRGEGWRYLGNFAVALASYDSALKVGTCPDDIWFARGVCLLNLKQSMRSISEFDSAIQRNSLEMARLEDTRIRMDGWAKTRGMQAEVDSLTERYRIRQKEALTNKASAQFRVHDYLGMLGTTERLIALCRSDYLGWYLRGKALLWLGDNNAALSSFDSSIALNRDFYESWYNKATAASRSCRDDLRVAFLDSALAICSRDSVLWQEHGRKIQAFRNWDARKWELMDSMLTRVNQIIPSDDEVDDYLGIPSE